jgi:flagellar basal body-associated protein FliL
MNKKGAELSMNVIVISILVILVLVIVAAFFMFGMTGLGQKIQSIFGIGVAGTDLSLAQQSCEQYCTRAKTLNENNIKSSPYCTQTFAIDKGEGIEKDADGKPIRYSCGESVKTENNLGVSCADNSGKSIAC